MGRGEIHRRRGLRRPKRLGDFSPLPSFQDHRDSRDVSSPLVLSVRASQGQVSSWFLSTFTRPLAWRVGVDRWDRQSGQRQHFGSASAASRSALVANTRTSHSPGSRRRLLMTFFPWRVLLVPLSGVRRPASSPLKMGGWTGRPGRDSGRPWTLLDAWSCGALFRLGLRVRGDVTGTLLGADVTDETAPDQRVYGFVGA